MWFSMVSRAVLFLYGNISHDLTYFGLFFSLRVDEL